MKQQIIQLLWEELGNRQEPEIQALLQSLHKMNLQEIRGIARLVLDRMMIIEVIKDAIKKRMG